MKPSCKTCGALMGFGPWACCLVCNSKDLSFKASVVESIPKKHRPVRYVPPPESKHSRCVHEIPDEEIPRLTMDTTGWGAALPRGILVSLAADAGVGKSTFLVKSLSTVEGVCLYGSSEESSARIAQRIRRIQGSPFLRVYHSNSLWSLLDEARSVHPDVFVVDSLNKTREQEVDGKIITLTEKMNALADFANTTGITTIVVCHVNSDGDMWGPNTLSHLTDVNVEIEKVVGGPSDELRVIRGLKNRFGATGRYAAFRHLENGLAWSEEDVVIDDKMPKE